MVDETVGGSNAVKQVVRLIGALDKRREDESAVGVEDVGHEVIHAEALLNKGGPGRCGEAVAVTEGIAMLPGDRSTQVFFGDESRPCLQGTKGGIPVHGCPGLPGCRAAVPGWK